MPKAVIGFLMGAGLIAALTAWFAPGNSVLAQHARERQPQEGDLITLRWEVDGKYQQLVLIDQHAKAMSVYHIDQLTGAVTLKSVRKYHWDLQLRGFNEVRPYSDEIRGMVLQR